MLLSRLYFLAGMIFAIFSASADAATMTYNSADVPKLIPDNTTVVSVLVIADSGTINDVNVRVTIAHSFDSDLDIFIVGPDGSTIVELSTDNGGAGDNYVNTVFDSQAAIAITAGSPPYTGSFRPEASLSVFNGLNINGTWTLRVGDDGLGDQGLLLEWALIADFDLATPMPEPSTLAILGGALLAAGSLRRRRRS